MKVEEQLAAALERAADRSPAPPKDLLATVGRGHRRRRLAQVTVAAAVALAVAGAGTLLRLDADGPPSPPEVGASPVSDSTVPAGQLWPHAVHRVPVMSEAGPRNPVTMVDDHRLLVSFQVADRLTGLAVVDVRTGEQRLVPGPGPAANAFTAHDGWIYWCENQSVWTVDADGTGKRLLASDFTTPCDRFVFADGALYVSGRLAGRSIVRVPLAGGQHVQVDGTVGRQLWTWPWATATTATAGQQPDALNVVTGERRTPRLGGTDALHWFATDGEQWLGTSAGGADQWRTSVVRTDASRTFVLQGFRGRTFNLGRFVGGTVQDDQFAVWDLRSGGVGTYGTPGLGRSNFDRQMHRPLAWWPADPDTLAVLDLARI